MTLDPSQTQNQLLIAAVAALVSGPVGYAVVQALKRVGLKGARKLRAAAWTICTAIVLGAWAQYTGADWSTIAMAAIAVLGAGGATVAHVIRESTRPGPNPVPPTG